MTTSTERTAPAGAADARPVALPTARVLTIAGTDSGGGAGVPADLKAMMALGTHGMCVVTAVTAQNSVGVQGAWPLPLDAIRGQFRSVVDDIGVDALKTGMLASAEIVATVAELVDTVPRRADGTRVPLVVDPVAMSKHGDPLLAADAIATLRSALVPLATVLTPNIPEAALLAGMSTATPPTILAGALLELGADWVLIKGGHKEGDADDLLVSYTGERHLFRAARADNTHTHGTGCTMASLIAAGLGQGLTAPEAVGLAKRFMIGAIPAGYALGAGIGPVDPLWHLREALADGGWTPGPRLRTAEG
ncbi:bifunctional hydroxymethylpyrimidine kinase/phosphomethylpyrimidine kinase [Raineyella sp. LH-20]|uniref:bifunctional hydroxymethylpyrimidine kinase/phosphomethylpyrimidine kinase n=1 Tax=Raineyella sp. LH-20 TaxID=3081204 RepID=UPI0029554DA5|nr:bifunctional hydroxymethylpyrimidine kinase/phosphomethylpyrimidine kinase [Raineyella sp. LH-20]WOP18306.1 bifunctional hydroxymethylpyrimidine kinase/phosphomethylpyrimidine kinase [Raineyella sp. LH-20]